MWKLRVGIVVAAGAIGLASGPAAWAAKGADANSGDVWLDNVGQPPGPGHEMDPHLACSDIALYGAGLADSSGTFTIDGWPPSGTKTIDYSGSWKPGSGQQIATVPIKQLMAGAQANGDVAAHQGFHFKLDFSQDPQKHKTFWVECAPASSGSGTPGGGTPGGQTPGGGTTPAGSTAVTTTTGTPLAKTSLGAARTSRPKRHATHRRRHRLVHPARRRHVRRRAVKAINLTAPAFTG